MANSKRKTQEINQRETKERAKKGKSVEELSQGVLTKLTDLALISIYYTFEFAFPGYGRVAKTESKAIDAFEELNYKSLARAFRHLKEKGLIKNVKQKLTIPELTEEGRAKLAKIVPEYKKRRTWEGKIYIITYDIPEPKSAQRNFLRRHLRDLGCAPLQKSVWVSPYNIQKSLKVLVKNHNLQGFIIVSSLGRDGTIGDVKVSQVMASVHRLDELNERYKKFVVKAGLGKATKHSLVFDYLAILKDDPQLPFDLLPDGWIGDHANQVFKRMVR
ncbi:MAG: PaaX family transcriptional regulator C-terminal domain-containing protein [Patescibacteria group bacterium]